MAGTPKRLFGPLALTTTLTTNIYQGAGASALVYDILTHLHLTNKHASIAAKATIYIGATGANAAGTEWVFGKAVPVGDFVDIYGALRLDSTDFLVGGADNTLALTVTGEGYRNVV